jgi:hypothetical protein
VSKTNKRLFVEVVHTTSCFLPSEVWKQALVAVVSSAYESAIQINIGRLTATEAWCAHRLPPRAHFDALPRNMLCSKSSISLGVSGLPFSISARFLRIAFARSTFLFDLLIPLHLPPSLRHRLLRHHQSQSYS